MNLWTFFNPENWLADENQLFPRLEITDPCIKSEATKNKLRSFNSIYIQNPSGNHFFSSFPQPNKFLLLPI